ncbi:MAG: hypothetical protein RBS91_08550 [Sulfurimonadaceae bacterium]|jgi:hypothetical protein|nr:hypothetical protein [Sulfurimonadaceae bacterium]
MSKIEFLSIYGIGAYLKLILLKKYLKSIHIDIRKLNNHQIAKMLDIEYH